MANDSGRSISLRDESRKITPSSTDFVALAKSINFNISIKLDRDNYVYWKAHVLPGIEAFKLDDLILGLKPIPPKYIEVCSASDGSKETIINKDFISWRKADKLLVCWLLSTISPSIIGEVISRVSAHDVWSTLKCLFSQQSLAKVLQLKQQLQNAKKGSISEFVLKVKGIGDALKGAGEVVQNRDLLLSILNGIGHEYDFIAVFIANHSHTMNLQETQYMLMVHEQRIEDLSSTSHIDVANVSANFVANNQNANRQP
ncbi:hypothetical protein ACOSQ2_019909 [Xanthoceras sorbifolium]